MDVLRLQRENTRLRRLLGVYSGLPTLYTDDGEMNYGGHPQIDFLRDSVEDIERKVTAHRTAAFQEKLTQVSVVSRDRVREIFLSAGFKIHEGHDDLKDYVYVAAQLLLVEFARLKPPQNEDAETAATVVPMPVPGSSVR